MGQKLAQIQLFDRQYLAYTYKWDVRRNENLKRKKTLDRTNGHEVLHYINGFFKAYSLSSPATFTRAEYLMYNHLPININNRSEITSWLLRNWDREQYL